MLSLAVSCDLAGAHFVARAEHAFQAGLAPCIQGYEIEMPEGNKVMTVADLCTGWMSWLSWPARHTGLLRCGRALQSVSAIPRELSLPGGFSLQAPVEFDQAISYVNKIKVS